MSAVNVCLNGKLGNRSGSSGKVLLVLLMWQVYLVYYSCKMYMHNMFHMVMMSS